MKIIKEGKCNHCHCEVEFKQGEAEYNSHRNETYYTILCPTPKCNHTISVEV